MSVNSLSQAATPLAALAERARCAGYDPWLFHRDGWDWCWRSWGQVADHVARSVSVLSDVASRPRRAGYEMRQHPDAVTAGLAIRAAGWIAVPIDGGPDDAMSRGCDAWVTIGATVGPVPSNIECVELPAVASPFEKAEPQALELGSASSLGANPVSDDDVAPEACKRSEPSSDDLAAAARRFDQRLPAARGRAIVSATPDLDPETARLLEAWTLMRGAAWLLEPEASAFIATVLWARPTVVWARAAELEQLAARLMAGKHRRRHRLVAVVVVGGEEADPNPWNALEVEVVKLGEESVPAEDPHPGPLPEGEGAVSP